MEKNTNDTVGKVGEVASNFAKDPMKSGSEYYREGSRAIASTRAGTTARFSGRCSSGWFHTGTDYQ